MFVKICGITSEEDALLAVAMGADALGFVFAPSPRHVAPERVADIVERLPHEIVTIGVFRDEAPMRVVEVCQRAGLRGAQLHGGETVADTRHVHERLPVVIKAFPAGDPRLAEVDEYGADAVLIDSPRPGSGETFDWRRVDGLTHHRRVLLAGGLTPTNVAAAVEQVGPWGVDVSTGVEVAPGRKDPRKLKAFVDAARSVQRADAAVHGPLPDDWILDR